jgi:O-antigen ligase
MISLGIEKRLTTIFGWGCLIVTLLVTDRISADPVNVSKMVALSGVAGASLAILFTIKRENFRNFKVPLALIIMFLFACFVSMIHSKSPWEKGFFGTYGRNTGLLTYIGLSIVFVAGFIINRTFSYFRILRFFLMAGVINLIYCLFAINGYDIFTWNNPYGKTLGTFGNPNFISSFMGIFITALFANFFVKGIAISYRLVIISLILLSAYTINASGSQQGGVVAAGGMSIVLFFYLRHSVRNLFILITYSTVVVISGVTAILGMLQMGPLSGLLYKQSVSLRGEYWQAGLNMAIDNPIFGVGPDSYGTFYRSYREQSATLSPGVDTISDAAHNIFIDIAASIGILGFVFYFGLILFILYKSFVYFRRFRDFDPIFVTLFSCWLAYQAQCIISINQIGIAVWGWALGGLLVGYTTWQRGAKNEAHLSDFNLFQTLKTKEKEKVSEVPASVALATFALVFISFAISAPSFYADAKLRQSISSGSNDLIYEAATQYPLDSNRINFLAAEITKGGINQQGVDLVRLGIKKYPYDYGLNFSEFQLSIPGSKEQITFGRKLHQLDPHNPAYFKYK